MSGKLNTFVFVHRDGESKAFGPNDIVPEWAAELITNPAVWATPPTKAQEPGSGADNGGDDQGGAGNGGTDQTGVGTGGDGQSDVRECLPDAGSGRSSAPRWER